MPGKLAWPPSGATAEAEAAHGQGQHEGARHQEALAASYQVMHDAYTEREFVFAGVMADRQDWELATRRQRQLAVAADAELRRRHPGQRHPPLRSAEPQPATGAERDELSLTAGKQIGEMSQWIKDLAAQHREFTNRLAERHSLLLPAQDPDLQRFGTAFPAWESTRTDAILQPPKPQIQPSPQVLDRLTDRDLNIEAAE